MKKALVVCLCILISYSQTFAVDSRLQDIYNDFKENIEKKYSFSKQKELYQLVREKGLTYRQEDISESQKSLTNDLLSLNNETLYDIWLQEELSQSQQKILEITQRKTLSSNISSGNLPTSVKTLTALAGIKFIATNDQREFAENGNIYRLSYSKYFQVTTSGVPALAMKSGVITQDSSGEYRFIEEYEYIKKIPYSELINEFQVFLTDKFKIQNVAGIYKGYNFSKFRFFDDTYGVYQDQLDSSGFDPSQTLIYRDENDAYNFITDYTMYEIAREQDLFGVSQKHLFLDYLREDAKFQTQNMPVYINQIRYISESLSAGKDTQESIKAIYNWILENISYSTQIDLNDEKIFSGIETYKNGAGVCTGYTKLSMYLFLFAGIYDAQVIRGHVIDAQDFPDIGHAWLRIADLYYDPTFDDPVGISKTRSFENYKYYGLPRDIFYANRFEYGTLPDGFEELSDEKINQYIFNYLTDLSGKYSDSMDEYKVFAPINFRNTYNISPNTTITPELLATKIPYYDVQGDSFTFTMNGSKKRISSLKYYTLTDNNAEAVLDTLSYDLSNTYLFNWEVSPGVTQWRLGYDVQLR